MNCLRLLKLEGDIFKAVKAGNFEKVKKYFKRVIKAKIELSALESLNMK